MVQACARHHAPTSAVLQAASSVLARLVTRLAGTTTQTLASNGAQQLFALAARPVLVRACARQQALALMVRHKPAPSARALGHKPALAERGAHAQRLTPTVEALARRSALERVVGQTVAAAPAVVAVVRRHAVLQACVLLSQQVRPAPIAAQVLLGINSCGKSSATTASASSTRKAP